MNLYTKSAQCPCACVYVCVRMSVHVCVCPTSVGSVTLYISVQLCTQITVHLFCTIEQYICT